MGRNCSRPVPTVESASADSLTPPTVDNSVQRPSKLGRFRGAETVTRNHVIWPQEMVYVGAERHTADYDDLTPEQFITGFLKTMQVATPVERENMLMYGTHLFQDTVDTTWSLAKGAHAVVLREIEQSRLS